MQEVKTLDSYLGTLATICLTRERRNSGFEPYQELFLEAFETLDPIDVQQLLVRASGTYTFFNQTVVTVDILRRAIERGVNINGNKDDFSLIMVLM